METYPLVDAARSPKPFAFEIDTYVGLRAIARVLASIDGVTDVQRRKLFKGADDVRIDFKYLNRDHEVWEPFGDNSRYWIGPKDTSGPADIVDVEAAFKRFTPPQYRDRLGDLLLRVFRRNRH